MSGVPAKVDTALLQQMDHDFQALLEANEGDASMAFREACAANLGFLVTDGDAEEQVFMFKDDSGDLQAASTRVGALRQHLEALKTFTESDFQAALEA